MAEVRAEIVITNSSEGIGVSISDPGTSNLTRGVDHIRWYITNNSTFYPVRVIIDRFEELASPFRERPFGDNSPSDNLYSLSLGGGPTASDTISQIATAPTVSSKDRVQYKYFITVKDHRGRTLGRLDPMVVISGGGFGGSIGAKKKTATKSKKAKTTKAKKKAR
jgi:hypothetical protein